MSDNAPNDVSTTDDHLKVLAINDIRPPKRVDGNRITRSIASYLQRNQAPSTTRSDRLAAEMYARKLDPKRIVGVLDQMLSATKISRGGFSIPDWRARIDAIRLIADVQGWYYAQPTKTDVTISQTMISVVRDVQSMSPEQLVAELPGAMKILQSMGGSGSVVSAIAEDDDDDDDDDTYEADSPRWTDD